MVTCDLWTCDHEIFMNDMCFMWCMCYIICMYMDAVGHLPEAQVATAFVVIGGAQDFLRLFIISNPSVDPGPLPKKYEGRTMELWTGEKSNCHFYGLCYKDSRPREFQVSCL